MVSIQGILSGYHTGIFSGYHTTDIVVMIGKYIGYHKKEYMVDTYGNTCGYHTRDISCVSYGKYSGYHMGNICGYKVVIIQGRQWLSNRESWRLSCRK